MALQGTQRITKERWQRIKEVFEAVLETPREERSSAVAELCHGDTSLCVEVESLLEGLDQAEAFMQRPAIAGVAAEFSGYRQTFEVGDVVSARFKIVRFIGRGGMGEVYEAQDPEIDAQVALKTILPEIAANPSMLARFKLEAQLTRLVTHPNVCRTFDVSRHRIPASDSTPARDVIFLTMELLEGETLAQRLRRGRMTTEEALPLIRQMAAALDSAHEAGVIHRDFKPGNVMLCQRSSIGAISEHVRAVVTDFGLARNLSLAENLSLPLTKSGAVIGTLSYMAPEQLEGNELTPAADIYSFGLVIYEMLTGRQPFGGKTALTAVMARLKKPPVRPRTHVPELSPSLESAILRCLAIEPKNRFERASQVCESLEQGQGAHPALHKKTLPVRHWILLSFGFLLLAALGIWMVRPLVRSSRQAHALRELLQFTADGGITKQPTVSADGQIVAFLSDRAGDGILNVWAQSARGGAATQVTHESFNCDEPDISPDGKEITFQSDSDGGVYVVSASGGLKKLVAAKGRGPRFSPDGKEILYWAGDDLGSLGDRSFYPNAKVYVAPVDGGATQRIGEQFADARWPAWSSDGKVLLFGIPYGLGSGKGQSAFDLADWWVLDPNKPDPPVKTGVLPMIRSHLIEPMQAAPRWWKDWMIFSARTGQSANLYRVHISRANFQITGEPEQLTFGTTYDQHPAISSTGQLFLTSLSPAVNIWGLPLASPRPGPFPRSALMPLVHVASIDTRPSISLNGERLVFARRAVEKRTVWLKNLVTGKENQLTQAEGTSPIISRDGKSVAFSLRSGTGPTGIKVLDLSADGTAHGVKEVCGDCGEPMDWSTDGSGLLYSYAESTAIGLVEVKSGRKTALLRHTSALGSASFCPRDECVVFVELLDGVHSRIWLAPMRDHALAPEAQWTQITDGRFVDDKPRWSPDGKWLYFYSSRDGFRCLWKLRFVPGNHRPQGAPQPVIHLHDASLTLSDLSRAAFDLRVGNDKLVFAAVSESGNIWKTDLENW